MAHLVGCCVHDVCCVLCFALQPTTRDDCTFFSGRNFVQFPTVGQTTVHFVWAVCQNTITNKNNSSVDRIVVEVSYMTSPRFKCGQSWNRISVGTVLFFRCLSIGDVCIITHHQNLKPCFLCHHQLQVMCFCYRH